MLKITPHFLLYSCLLAPFSSSLYAIEAISGDYTVGFGPVKLGSLSLTTQCDTDTCQYKSRAKGSFLFIDADVKEQGSYQKVDQLIIPITGSYEEEIGSNHRSYYYDFEKLMLTDLLKDKQKKMKTKAYPFIPLLQQVSIDLMNGGPKKEYTYVLKKKIKPVVLANYKKEPFEGGVRHHIFVTKKDSELEFIFMQKDGKILLEKLNNGSFWLAVK